MQRQQLQAAQREIRIDRVESANMPVEHASEAARRDCLNLLIRVHAVLGSQLVAQSIEHAFEHRDRAEHRAAANAVGGVAPDGVGRHVQIHGGKASGAIHQCSDRDADSGRDGAAQVGCVGRDHVEGGGRAEINHDARLLVSSPCCDGVRDAIGPELERFVHGDANP